MVSLKCLFGFHKWGLSRFVVLGFPGASYICDRCGKVVNQ